MRVLENGCRLKRKTGRTEEARAGEGGYIAKTQQVILLWAAALQTSNLRPEETQLSLRIRVSCHGQGSRHTERWTCPTTRE